MVDDQSAFYAGGHRERVTLFTVAIAQAMGLPRDKIIVIARGAFLHDIGKLAIPDAILRKTDSLSAEESAIMQEHPYRGYQIVRNIPALDGEASEVVYAHHEWYDGNGYPRRLKGEQIPLGARIVAVANTFDSITSDLPYRSRQPLKAARAEIERWSGRQFDPEIVRIFLEMPDAIWDDLRRDIDPPTHEPDVPVPAPLKPQPHIRSGAIALPEPEPDGC